MHELKEVTNLPQTQQKALFTILRTRKPAIRTSEVHEHIDGNMTGRSVGAVLGALYRNGYLEKVSGGRDKMWKLSDEADKSRDSIRQQLSEVMKYWG